MLDRYSVLTAELQNSASGRKLLAFDWATTEIGKPETWPASLFSLTMMMLACPKPIILAWGPELIVLHNDAYLALAGSRGANALGKPLRDYWSERWEDVKPSVDIVLKGRHMPDAPSDSGSAALAATTTYSALRDESGAISGLMCMVGEATEAEHKRIEADALRPGFISPDSSVGEWDWDVVADRVTTNARYALLHCVDPARAAAAAPLAAYLAGVDPEDLPRVKLEIEAAMQTRRILTTVYRLVNDGEVRWVCAQGRGTYNAKGECTRLAGVSFDISDRMAAEGASGGAQEAASRG